MQQMPSLSKLSVDGQYLGHVEGVYKNLRNLDLRTRQQLLKNNDNMEEEEYRDKVESLKNLLEAYKMIALGDEPSDEDSEGNQNESDY